MGLCNEQNFLTDGCDFVQPYSNGRCDAVDPLNDQCGSNSCQGQTFGASSACLSSSFARDGFSQYTSPGVGCYEYRCVADATKAGGALEVRTPDGDWHACDASSSSLAFTSAGYTGTLSCPPAAEQGLLCYDSTATVPPDPDECALGVHNCDTLAACSNTEGSFACTCNAGYTGAATAGACTDADECAAAAHNCDADAACNNTVGSFTCACNSGFYGEGTVGTCTAVDTSCGTACDSIPNTVCANTVCVCAAGYAGDPCTDIDECSSDTHNCHAEAACANTAGTFTCTCNAGYNGDGALCSDIDECTSNAHDCAASARCSNLLPGFSCACNTGFAGSGVVCEDEDECASSTHSCSAAQTCANTAGSFTCTSPDDPGSTPATVPEGAVQMAVRLPYTVDDFTTARQTAFRRAVASSAETTLEQVTIDSIDPVSARRLSPSSIASSSIASAASARSLLQSGAGGIDVRFTVRVASEAAAQALISSGAFSESTLNTALAAESLEPLSAVASSPTVSAIDPGTPAPSRAVLHAPSFAVALGLVVLAWGGLRARGW